MSSKTPEHLKVDEEELEVILNTVKPHLSPSHFEILSSAIKTLLWLQTSLKEKGISIKRLCQMMFGRRNESYRNLKKDAEKATKRKDTTNESPIHSEQVGTEQSDVSASDSQSGTSEAATSASEDKQGHGHRPLNGFDVHEIFYIPHKCLKNGDICPECRKGKVYNLNPEVLLVFTGQSLLKGKAYSAQRLRCNLCGKIFKAAFPKEVISQPRADLSARAIVSLAKYQLGTPLYRLETWQKLMGLPVSDAEMWEWTESVALVCYPVYQALLEVAAKGEVIHNDDTKARVLELMVENRLAAETQLENHRKGMYTSILLSKLKDGLQIPIYVTGRKNSGENLDDLLDRRPKDYEKPIQSCDASTQNLPERHETDIAYCFNHARHNFCELVSEWPHEVLTLVKMCNDVFMNDRTTRDMTQKERLEYHKKFSAPIMNELRVYCNRLLDEKIVEPNSSLGKAIKYVNKHWQGLTLFLRDGRAPLSNNDGERALKSKVLIRKNSYFYRTAWGAFIGDILLSMSKICNLNGINAYDYLIAIQANAEKVKQDPKAWLPWNYLKNTTCPFVGSQLKPVEEVYQVSSTGAPIITRVDLKPDFENNKKPLRDRAREFFKKIYPQMELLFGFCPVPAPP